MSVTGLSANWWRGWSEPRISQDSLAKIAVEEDSGADEKNRGSIELVYAFGFAGAFLCFTERGMKAGLVAGGSPGWRCASRQPTGVRCANAPDILPEKWTGHRRVNQNPLRGPCPSSQRFGAAERGAVDVIGNGARRAIRICEPITDSRQQKSAANLEEEDSWPSYRAWPGQWRGP